jgi:hypothetical protein
MDKTHLSQLSADMQWIEEYSGEAKFVEASSEYLPLCDTQAPQSAEAGTPPAAEQEGT